MSTLAQRRECLHQLTNHLTAVDGYLEIDRPKDARRELKKAIACIEQLRELLRLDEQVKKKK